MNNKALRFQGFDSEWKTQEFSIVFDFLRNNSLSRAELSDSGNVMNIHYGDVLIKFGECIDLSKQKLPYIKDSLKANALFQSCPLKNGDIIFADAAEDYTVGKCSELIAKEEAVVSGLHTIPCRPKIEFAQKYLGYFLNSPCFHNQLIPYIQGSKVSSISRKAIINTSVYYPIALSEQQSFADFLSFATELINRSTEQLEKLKNIKQSCLQGMFPADGEKVPEIRFAGYSDSWECATLGELFDERQDRSSFGELLSVTIKDGIKKFSELERHDNSSSNKSNYKVVYKDDVAYNSMRMWQGASGCSDYNGIVSPAYTVLIPKEGLLSRFFSFYFKNENIISLFRINSQGLTSDTWNLKYPAFSKIRILYPTDINEQRAIAQFFCNLEYRLKMQQAELERLKQIKSACLSGMFVQP